MDGTQQTPASQSGAIQLDPEEFELEQKQPKSAQASTGTSQAAGSVELDPSEFELEQPGKPQQAAPPAPPKPLTPQQEQDFASKRATAIHNIAQYPDAANYIGPEATGAIRLGGWNALSPEEQKAQQAKNIAAYPENQPKPPVVKPRLRMADDLTSPSEPKPYTPPTRMQRPENQEALEQEVTRNLGAANRVLVEPFEKMSQAGAKKVRGAAITGTQAFVEPALAASSKITGKPVPPGLRDAADTAEGIAGGVGATAGGLAADPRMWPFFFAGGTPGIGGRAMSAGFGLQMGAGAVEQAGELAKVWDNPDIPRQQKVEMGTTLILSALMAYQAGKHAAKPEHLLYDFSRLPDADQQAIRDKLRQKSPELAKAVDQAQAGAQKQQPAASQPIQVDPSEIEVEPKRPAQPAGKFRMPKGQIVVRTDSAVRQPNIDKVVIDGQHYAFDKRKTNGQALQDAHAKGELWKLTGEKPPQQAAQQVELDLSGEQANESGITRESPAVQQTESQAQPVAGQVPDVLVKEETPKHEQKMVQQPEPVTRDEAQQVGQQDTESERPILQPTDEPMRANQLAVQAAPELETKISHIASTVPGVKFERLRPRKDLERVEQKTDDQKPPETISDYLAGQVAVDSPEAAQKFRDQIASQFEIVDEENKLLEGRKDKAGYPSWNLQVKMSNGLTAELQIVPREVQEASDESHKYYTQGREAKSDTEKDELWGKAAEINGAALAKFKQRNGLQDATSHFPTTNEGGKQGVAASQPIEVSPDDIAIERPAVDRAKAAAAAHASGDTEGAREHIRSMVREKFGRKEEASNGRGQGYGENRTLVRPAEDRATYQGEERRQPRNEATRSRIAELQRELVGERNPEKQADIQDAIAREKSGGRPTPEDKPFTLESPPEDVGAKQYIANLPEGQQGYAQAVWKVLKASDVSKLLNSIDVAGLLDEKGLDPKGHGFPDTDTADENADYINYDLLRMARQERRQTAGIEKPPAAQPAPTTEKPQQPIRQVSDVERKALEAIPAGSGTTGFMLLTRLVEEGGLSESAANSAIAGMIRRGFVERVEDIEADGGRFKRTKEGTAALRGKESYGSQNTVFTADKRDAALKRLRAKMGGQLSSGIDPEHIQDLVDVGGYHFEAGLRAFGDWSKQVVQDVGQWAEPYLKTIHEEISSILGAEGSKISGGVTGEKGVQTRQPSRREGRQEVPVPGSQGRPSSEHPPAQAVRGAEAARETAGPSAKPSTAGMERSERIPERRSASEPGGRAGTGADPAAERSGRRGRERGADGKPVEARSPDPPAQAISEQHTQRQSKNFRYANPQEVGKGGEMAKIDQNISAIKLLKTLSEEGRHATPEEQQVLARYTGWGGLSGIFNRSSAREYRARLAELTDAVTNDELRGIQRSTINAHYTSPEVVDFMWKMAQKMGFEGGRIIEPGMGVGYFYGLMPEEMMQHPDTRLLGVELDPITGRIAQELYQGAKILNTGYEKVQIPDNSLDFAIGNVPFVDVKPFDPRYSKLDPRPSLHDYYFLKTLDKVRPGGIVSFITSRYSMDKVDSRIREMMADRADLVAAYRLPNTAFKGVAGTKVTADLLVLRKRFADEPRAGEPFMDVVQHKEGIKINQYFHEHPENMFGSMEHNEGNAPNEPGLAPQGELAAHMENALSKVAKDVYGKRVSEPDQPAFADPTERSPGKIKEGQFYLDDKGQIRIKRNGVPVEIPKELLRARAMDHIKAAINLREKAAGVLAQMLADKEDEPLKPLQAELNQAYDSYTRKYGFTHSKELATHFGSDPDYGLLLALENQNKQGTGYLKADIFSKRTMRPWERLHALPDEPESWVPASLSALGKLDPEYIADLTGKDPKEVIKALADKNLVFRDPESNDYLTADEYLSGNVRDKLETARKAAEVDEKFQANVAALEKSQPDKVPILQIQPKLGMSWIDPHIYEDFIHDMAESPEHKRSYYNMGSRGHMGVKVNLTAADDWNVSLGNDFDGVRLSNKFGTKDVSGAKILDDTLNMRQTNVYYRDENGKPKLDKVATLAARESQQRLKDAFNKWFYEKSEHHPILEEKYNRTFNGTRLREFDGSHLTFPGMNPEWIPHSHQANAIWRIVSHGRGLLAHAVGAGKTLEMIASGMEMRRLGISRKNMYAVPNNMVGQWNHDFARIYPAARVLAAPEKGFSGSAERNEFMAKAATGDWDAVIVPHSVFDMVPVSDELQTKVINREIESAREALRAVQDDEGLGQQTKKRTIKQMEKKILKYEARLEKLASGKKDNSLRFDQLGVDTLFVDEAHRYKNLQVNTNLTNVAGIPTSASQRALDALMKTEYMLDSHKGRGVVFATGTPITNTVAETYNMTRFVAPDALGKAGIHNFDQWRGNFADEVTSWEYAPDGVTFRPVTSLSQFINVPELATMFRSFADVKTKQDLNLPVPNALRKDVVVKVTDDQNPLLQEIAERAERMRKNPAAVDPRVDNWLKLSSDARKISLDPRLYVSALEDHPDSKLNAAAREAKRIYDESKGERGVQIFFSDFFASHDLKSDTEQYNALKDLKNKLVKAGVPAKEIAIATDYSKGQMRSLQEDAREGRIRFLMGSTEKLGVGLNVQDRLKAIHHLDQPWRPADVEQREGRILRPGNQYADVEVLRYISEPQRIDSPKAFDLQMFQKLERKAKFIDQFMQGGVKARTMEEAAGRAMLTPQDFAIAKAQATGNPDAMKKIQLEHESNRLYLLQRDWNSKRGTAVYQAKFAEEQANNGKARLEEMNRTREQHEAWEKQPEDQRIVAVIDGREFKNEKDNSASKQIQEYIAKQHPVALSLAGNTYHIHGAEIPVRVTQFIKDTPVAQYQLGEWHSIDSSAGFFPSVTARLRNVEKTIGALKDDIEQDTQKAQSYRQQLNDKSPYEDKLAQAEKELMETNKRLGIGVEKIEEQLGDQEPQAEAEEGPDGHILYSGIDPLEAYRAIRKTITDAGKLGKLYTSAVDKLLEKLNIGKPRPEIRQFDPDAADLAVTMDAGGQYHKAVGEMIARKIEGPLLENFSVSDSPAERAEKNRISRDRMKGLHWMGDAQNREWLKENHPEDYARWSQDQKIAHALSEYKPFEETLRNAVKELGGKTIDEDYIKRVMDFTTSGVAWEGDTLATGTEGPEMLYKGQSKGAGAGKDSIVSPQVDRSKARKDAGQYYWDHGVYDFGPSFQKRWIEVMSKLDEHRLAVHAMSRGTRLQGADQLPSVIYYNGKEFYRGDIAKDIREVKKHGTSAKSKELADALGVSELPTPKDVREYSIYEPMKGSRMQNAARNLASRVLSGEEDLQGQAANLHRMTQLRYALPKEITEALEHADRPDQGRLAKVATKLLGPVTQFIRQQIVGLAYGVPHMANILRKVIQASPGGHLNPKSYANAWKVAFSKELKARAISGPEDPGFDALLRNAGISDAAIPDYKHYIEGNFDLSNWQGLQDSFKKAGAAFREGGRQEGRITPGSALAGVPRLLVEPLNRLSEAGHHNLFKPGGIDQRARLWLHDFLKDRYKSMSDADIAHEVNQTLGRYNRASWTDLQRGLAPFVLFPGWDYSSITYALKHPLKTKAAPALLILLANMAVNAMGGNKRKDRHDMNRLHFGKYSISTNLLNDNAGGKLWGWATKGMQDVLDRKRPMETVGDATKEGLRGAAGTMLDPLNPIPLAGVSLRTNRELPGSKEIAPASHRGKKLVKDYAGFVGRKMFPIYDRLTDGGLKPSWKNLGGLAGVSISKDRPQR